MTNDDITTLLLVLAPATLVMASSYLLIRRMLEADLRRKKAEILFLRRGETLKIRFTAMERLVVLMERLSPAELLLRTTRQAATAGELQLLLLDAVRNEMERYQPYQLYVNVDTWQQVAAARNAIVALINQSAAEVRPDEPAIHLSKKILADLQALTALPTADAIAALREEAQHLFA
ncbi:MAG: hypothetical protein LBU42_02575 [Prevotellaceae bacterium]|jgi:hypothetical protein|nr:hypothetical protein [Prevotellaceae bacterium]